MPEKRKLVNILLLILSALFVIYMLLFFDSPRRFSEFLVSEQEYGDIVSARLESSDNMLQALIFDEETLFFDSKADVFYYSLLKGNSDSYNPYIEYKSDKKISLAVLGHNITEEDIRNNFTNKLLVYDDSTYKEYSLKCTTLPMLNISCGGAVISDTGDTPMKITLFDNSKNAAKRVTYSDGNIHVRGGTTKRYPKLGYKISLTQKSLGDNNRKNHTSLLGMRKDDDWILYSAYNDQEKIRNVFSSNLWQYSCACDNEYGINTGIEYKYIELFMDGEYWGLYALGFPIDEKQLEIAQDSNKAILFQKYFWDNESYLRFNGKRIEGYELKSVSDTLDYDAMTDKWSLLIDYYRNLYNNSENNEFLYGGIDINNAIDTYLYLNLIQAQDNIDGNLIKNIYITIKEDKGCLKAIYSPWDLDTTWGNSWSGEGDNFTLKYDVSAGYNQVMESGYLYQLIMNKDPDIWPLIIDKYNKLRSTVWSNEFICFLLDKYEEDIYYSGAYLRDMERWADGTYADAQDGLSTFRKFVLDRLDEYDEYYKRIEALDSKSIFAIRGAQYKDFPESSFIIELGDKSVLSDSDYLDLLEYIGVDIKNIADNTAYILINGKEKKSEYLSDLESAASDAQALIGNIKIDESNNTYTVYQNGVEYYTGAYSHENVFKLIFINNDSASEFDFSRGFGFNEYNLSMDMYQYIENLYLVNDSIDSILFEIKKKDILYDRKYQELFEKFGIEASQLNDNTDFIIADCVSKRADALDNFCESGSVAETSIGKFSLFVGEGGVRGLYINDIELYVDEPQENNTVDLRITVFDREDSSINERVSFSYETDLTSDGYNIKTVGMER